MVATLASYSGTLQVKPQVLNLGQGSSLARIVTRALKIPVQAFVDQSIVSENVPSPMVTEDAIAVVGMAVNLPGARDTEELWKLLERGLNTLEEVRLTRPKCLASNHFT